MEFSEYLEEIGKQGNHWMNYYIIMDKVRTYEKKYNIKIWLITQDKVKTR